MEDKQGIQQLSPEKNGKNPQLPLLPVYTPLIPQKTDDWDLQQFLTVVRRRAVVIGSVAIALCAGVWVWTLSRQAIYEGKFGLLVEPVTSGNDLAGLSSMSGKNSNFQQDGLDYDTQILVLKSPELLNSIIPIISARYQDVNYSSLVENLKISRLLETKIIEVSYEDSDPQKIQFVLQQLAKGYVKYSAQQRQNSLVQGIHFVDFQLPQLRKRVNSLQIQLQRFREQYNFVEPDGKTFLLYTKISDLQQQRLDVQKRLAETRRFYAALQGKSGSKLAMQVENGGFDLTLPAQSSATQIQSSGLNQTAQNQVGVKQDTSSGLNQTSQNQVGVKQDTSSGLNQTSAATQREALNRTPQTQSGAAAVQNEGSIYQRLVAQLRDLDTQIAIDSTRFREDSPTIVALKQKRKNLLPILQQEAARTLGNKLVEVGNQISGLETQGTKIAQAENSLSKQIKQLPNLARRYTDLQRELAIATESLNRFLEKRESLEVEAAQKETPWQLIASPGLPGKPVSPNVPRNLILGAIAGLLAGIGTALLVERLDNGFHSANDLKELTKLPLLGVIPFQKHLRQLAFAANSTVETNPESNTTEVRRSRPEGSHAEGYYNYFPFLEAFRSLHTNISFLSSDTPIKSIVVSSAAQGDGKSTNALHLAETAAAMGRRVLVVDADLRRPQIHTKLGISNDLGLSNVISGNLPVLDAIGRSHFVDDFFVLTAGQAPPDPIKLLSSKKMQNIVHQLRQEFDLVIYDTPPLLGFADGSLLSTYTDGILLVVRMGKTDRSAVMQALDKLKLSRTTILGTIFNSVKEHNSSNAYNYYYYRTPNQKPRASTY